MAEQTYYSCAQLAALALPGYPGSERRFRDLVEREGWAYREVKSKGGKGGFRREYLPPERVAKLIAAHTRILDDGAEARQVLAMRNLARAEQRDAEVRKTQVSADQLMGLLTDEGRARFDAHYDVLLAWRDWWANRQAEAAASKLRKPSRNAAFAAFAEEWQAGRVKASEAAKEKYPEFSARTIQRWVLDNEKDGLAPVADRRAVKGKGPKSIFETTPVLEKVFIGLLTERPTIQNTHLTELINHARKDFETGEVLFPPVSYWAVCRYREKFVAQNRQSLLAIENPDAWKSKYLSALGRADGDVHRLNQVWELDGTPADWELVGGRYTASVVIDVWSRRPMIRFSKTPRTETNKLLMRDAVLAWGVPEGAHTDNGSDYKSREFQLFLEEMGIAQQFCTPFSPWEKPHVESFIKTYLHGMLEVLSQFIGHSVADRSAIEARQSFADTLFKKNAVVKVDLTVEEMQRLTNAWVEGTYMQNTHSSLGMSPFERLASSTAPIRRVENERALDILLARPAARPIISAKGIRYDKADFIHAELPLHAGKVADIRLDPADLGRLYVYVDNQFLCVAECAERTGINRAEVAAHGRALQKKVIGEKKAELKRAKKALPMSTDALVKDLIVTRAERAGKLTRIERAEDYKSAALEEAARAAKADEPPQPSAIGQELIAEAKRWVAELQNPKAPVMNLAERLPEAQAAWATDETARRAGIDPMTSAENPLSHMNDDEKFDFWHRINEVAKKGDALQHDWQRRFYAGFPQTPKFVAMKSMRAAWGTKQV